MAIKENVLYKTNLFAPDGSTPLVSYVRVDPQALTLQISDQTNDAPQSVDQSTTLPIRVTAGRRYGITARHVVISRLAGSSPNQYKVYRKIVVFDPDIYQQYLSLIASSISYESQTDWILVGGINEKYRLNYGAAQI